MNDRRDNRKAYTDRGAATTLLRTGRLRQEPDAVQVCVIGSCYPPQTAETIGALAYNPDVVRAGFVTVGVVHGTFAHGEFGIAVVLGKND